MEAVVARRAQCGDRAAPEPGVPGKSPSHMDMVPLRVIVDLVAKAHDVCTNEARTMLRIPLQQLGYSPTATRLTTPDAVALLEQLGSGVTMIPPSASA